MCGSLAFAATPVYTYKIQHSYPHDPQAFTQGLIYLDGYLYESTGLNGRSSLRMVELTTGRVVRQQPVSAQFFAEGLTNWKSHLIQLTWKAETAFEYDEFTFRTEKLFQYPGEGWGITQDGKNLFMSDGSANLRVLNPDTFTEVRRIHVTDEGHPVDNLNELEYIKGEIYANIWQTTRIARISPVSGKVTGWIDCTGLQPQTPPAQPIDVLNGIAYDKKSDRLFVTGKLWPALFELKLALKP